MSQAVGDRRRQLVDARVGLTRLPASEFFELPGRPNVIYTMADYGRMEGGIDIARREVPFLFKAFETGQARPPRPGTKAADEPRASTIHEYLDWTVTAAAGGDADDDLDFGGFRTVLLVPRFRPSWPPPGVFDSEVPKKTIELGAPRCPLPLLLPKSKPVSAATIRCGLDYLEVPFFATHDSHRNQGFGRALLEALEDIARACGLPRMLLCSTDDALTRNTWRHLGFVFTEPQDLEAFGVRHGDLMHMDNTVQMHKTVPPARRWKSIVIRHDQWAQRVYYPPTPDALTGPLLGDPSQPQHSLQEPKALHGPGSAIPSASGLSNGHTSYTQPQHQQEGAGRMSNGGATLAGHAVHGASQSHFQREGSWACENIARGMLDAEVTEMTEGTDITISEQDHAQPHPQISAWPAPLEMSTSHWQPEGLEVTGPAQRWRGFGECGPGIALSLP